MRIFSCTNKLRATNKLRDI